MIQGAQKFSKVFKGELNDELVHLIVTAGGAEEGRDEITDLPEIIRKCPFLIVFCPSLNRRQISVTTSNTLHLRLRKAPNLRITSTSSDNPTEPFMTADTHTTVIPGAQRRSTSSIPFSKHSSAVFSIPPKSQRAGT